MTLYSNAENSTNEAAPVELYRFDYGLDTFCFTSSYDDYTHEGLTYKAEALSRTELDQSKEDQAGSITITVPADCPVARLFIAYLPAVPVTLRLYRMHRSLDAVIIAFAGTVNAAKFKDGACELVCQASTAALGRPVPATLFQSQCNRTLFSRTSDYSAETGPGFAQTIGCNARRDAYEITATVVAIEGLTVSADAFASKPAGWLRGGYVKRASGEVRWITNHGGVIATLVHPFADLEIGEVLLAYPGCDGSADTCRSKFNNIENFGGFDFMPTTNPFNSSLI